MSEPIHYPGITSCGCPYIKQPDPARHWKDCHYRLNSERDAQQAEPTDTFTAVGMATAAAQGFRDGQPAAEPAPAQDEREAPIVVATAILGGLFHGGSGPELGEIDIEVCTPALETIQCETVNSSDDVFLPMMTVAQHERIVASLTRPAQTEQQPVGRVLTYAESLRSDGKSGPAFWFGPLPAGAFLYAAPIAQTAPQPEQSGLVEMIDAAMIEMRNIAPPLRRSDCERLIRAALSAQGAGDADS